MVDRAVVDSRVALEVLQREARPAAARALGVRVVDDGERTANHLLLEVDGGAPTNSREESSTTTDDSSRVKTWSSSSTGASAFSTSNLYSKPEQPPPSICKRSRAGAPSASNCEMRFAADAVRMTTSSESRRSRTDRARQRSREARRRRPLSRVGG